eukprot:1939491-Lingulodinium_polyedra.AAC.1
MPPSAGRQCAVPRRGGPSQQARRQQTAPRGPPRGPGRGGPRRPEQGLWPGGQLHPGSCTAAATAAA